MESLWAVFRDLAERVGAVEAILAPARPPLRFGDLPARLERVRETLAREGIGRGDRVVSVLPRGPETAVCYLGVAACATYVPLNPEFSEAEFTALLERIGPAAVILPAGGADVARTCASALGLRTVDLVSSVTDPAGTFSLRFVGDPAAGPRTPEWNGAEDCALVLLTSGTTAAPKLVPLRVRHLLAYARQTREQYDLNPSDRCIHVMPMFHGHGLKSGLLCPLANGSGVVISPDFDVATFFQQIKAFRPTWYTAAASIHQAILAAAADHRTVAQEAKLRFIRSGSSRLDPRIMAGLEEAFGTQVVERYGMSETCTLATNPLPPGKRVPGSVGRPAGNEVAIVDESGRFLGPNREGEIVARGPSVFDGYLDDPEANRAAFINGWFRTGDLGRFDDDGYLTLTGRLKDVINRGGEKIGTAEIEAALMTHPRVAEACAFALPHPSLGEEVAAAVSVVGSVSEHELQVHARGLLAAMKVPRRIFFLPSLPRSATKKVARPETVGLCLRLAESQREPETRVSREWSLLEREIGDIWRDLLGVDEVALRDDFFLLGGDSLKAYELFARLRKAYGVAVVLSHIFEEAATIEGMARLIERARSSKSSAPAEAAGLVGIKTEGNRPPLFAIPGSGGNPVGFIHLGRLLDSRQPLIGIESRGFDGVEAPLARMEDIAADNIHRIRAAQPHGPYFLIGACFGGRVAYEIARQLEAAGEPVGLLLMLDASAPFFDADGRLRGEQRGGPRASRRQLRLDYFLRRVRRSTRKLLALRGEQRRRFLYGKIATVRRMFSHGDVAGGDRSAFGRHAVRVANRRAGQHYVPGPFGGPVSLFLTRDRTVTSERNYRLDWLDLVPQIGNPIYVSGRTSGDMLSLPHVYELAGVVNSQLEAIHDSRGDLGRGRIAS